MPLLAGLDLGTTNLKAVVYDSLTGKLVARASRPTPVVQVQTAWSEHESEALWQAVCGCMREACAGKKDIAALGIAGMAEAGFPLGSNAQVLDNAIAWFDRRSEPQTSWVEDRIPAADLYSITGQRVSPSFGLTKLLWLRENRPAVFRAMHKWLPLTAYIHFRLTGEFFVDQTIASRSLLYDQNTQDWSPLLLDLAGISNRHLPAILAGSACGGRLTADAAAQTGLPAGIPCAPGSHDHLAASFASGALAPGRVVDSTGTAQAVVQIVPHFIPDPLLAERGFACYAHVLPGQYILKAGLKAAGSAIEWLARLLDDADSEPNYSKLQAQARIGVGVRAGPLWLPHLLESGSPLSDRSSLAALVGARLSHDRGDLFRAMLESLAFWLRQNLDEMSIFAGYDQSPVQLIGGVTRLDLLSELKAQALNRPVQVSTMPEAAAVGAALLGGLAGGFFSSPVEAQSSLRYPHREFLPHPEQAAWYDRLYHESYLPLYPALRDIHRGLRALTV